MRRQNRKTKILLIGLMVVVAGTLAAVFVQYRRMVNRVDTLLLPEESGATLSLQRLSHTATRDGIKEWRLDAGSARFIDSEKRAILKDLSVIFYPKDGKPISVTADEGILKTDSNDIEASGNVVIKREDYRIDTDSIRYEHGRRMFHARQPVKISAGSFDLAADAMSFELDTQKTRLEGHVRGTIHESFL